MKRILIIDDDTTCLAAMHQMLKEDYRISLFVGGSGAIEAVEKIRPDLLVVDRHMPELSGIEICKWVKSPRPDGGRKSWRASVRWLQIRG